MFIAYYLGNKRANLLNKGNNSKRNEKSRETRIFQAMNLARRFIA